MSETSKRRHVLADYCMGSGVDLGYGGDPIRPEAITVDLPRPYTRTGDELQPFAPQNLAGDARDLYWFRDNVLDYVYSSHLLEDFEDPLPVLMEWCRVLKEGGKLVLLLPDEQAYREHCRNTGQVYNVHHKNPTLSLESFLALVEGELDGLACIHFQDLVEGYSFEVVFRKMRETVGWRKERT